MSLSEHGPWLVLGLDLPPSPYLVFAHGLSHGLETAEASAPDPSGDDAHAILLAWIKGEMQR